MKQPEMSCSQIIRYQYSKLTICLFHNLLRHIKKPYRGNTNWMHRAGLGLMREHRRTDVPQLTMGLYHNKRTVNWKYHESKTHLILRCRVSGVCPLDHVPNWSCGSLLSNPHHESIILHIAHPGKDQNPKFQVHAYHFHVTIKSKSWTIISWGLSVLT